MTEGRLKKMRKSIFTLVVLLMMVSASVFAQGTAASDATVTADVLANLTISGSTTLDFGNVAATSDPYVDPKGAAHVDVAGPTVGTFTIAGAPSASITVNFDATATLTDATDGSESMTFTPDLKGHATTQGSATTIADGGTVSLDGSGGFLMWLGGDLGNLSGQEANAYSTGNTNGSGPWAIDIIYN